MLFLFMMILLPLTSTLFPYTTLFRSVTLLIFTIFFISYAHSIFIKRRKKEFGLFMTLGIDRKSTRLNSSHVAISYAVFCLKKKKAEGDDEILLVTEYG